MQSVALQMNAWHNAHLELQSSDGWLNFLDFSVSVEYLLQYFWNFECIITRCLSLVPPFVGVI